MGQITATEVSKLRKATGAGMMDCKKALEETNGNFDKAIEIIRKKGQLIANKRADREASEGVVIAKVSDDNRRGAMIVLNCETDFVAKNESFVGFAYSILDKAISEEPSDLNELKKLEIGDRTIDEKVVEQIGVIGEKISLSGYEKLEAESVTAYIHPGNKLASMVGLNIKDLQPQIGKDMAMQIAAMNPVAVDKEDVPQEIIDKELEIGKEQAMREGKPENLLEKIAMGKLGKFYKESTLMNQEFIKDNKKTVRQFLQEYNKNLTITGFKRFSLTD
ncbi:MAG: elongation factor Ts [Bacteroidales bacterium]|nr:MAG: elongation factor Ts [Bacteroidales bacterium]